MIVIQLLVLTICIPKHLEEKLSPFCN